MADIAAQSSTATLPSYTAQNRVRLVESDRQFSGVASVNINAGQAIRQTTTGKLVLAAAVNSGSSNGVYIATKTVLAGQAVTGLKEGVIAGFDLSSQAFGANIFLSDTAGALTDTASTNNSVLIGKVVANFGTQASANAADKLLEVNIVT